MTLLTNNGILVALDECPLCSILLEAWVQMTQIQVNHAYIFVVKADVIGKPADFKSRMQEE